MKAFLTCCFFIFCCIRGYGQTVEELKEALQATAEDSTRVNTLISLSLELLNTNLNESKKYSQEAVVLAKKIDFDKGRGYALKAIGQAYVVEANYPEAIDYFTRSLNVFDSIGFKVGMANMLSNLGGVYFNSGDDTKALEYYLESLRVSEAVGDQLRIAIALNNIGGVYQNREASIDRARQYFLKALPIFEEEKFPDGIGIVSMNLGEIYAGKKQYDSALHYFENSLSVYEESIDATFPLNFLGKINAEQGNFDQAVAYHAKALEIAEKLNAKYEMTQVLLGLAGTQRLNGKTEEAIRLYHRAESLAREINAKNELRDAFDGLAELYFLRSDFEDAFRYKTLYAQIKDTLYNTANDKKLQQLQFNFDIEKKQSQIDLLTKDNELRAVIIERQKAISIASGVVVFVVLILAYGVINRSKYIRRTNAIINGEKERYENLLLNILPAETAHELQQHGSAAPRYYEDVTVLFTDFKGFSSIAGGLSPQELVSELNEYFIAFDDIAGKHNLEKIKTMGDAYMCAGGIPTVNKTHPFDAVKAAFAMQVFVAEKNARKKLAGLPPWELRIGIHTGPVVAGVVGKRKYAYDIWGNTVNIASRMETSSRPGRVNISEATYELVKDLYVCEHRGKISAKNIGEIDMYFVEPDFSPEPTGRSREGTSTV